MLPDWNCGGDATKERALSRFIIEILLDEHSQQVTEGARRMADTDPADREPAELAQFIHAVMTSGLGLGFIDRIGHLAGINIPEIMRQIAYLRWHGFEVTGGEQPNQGRKRERSEAFYRAAADVPRIRALFLLHFDKRNRMERPMAEEIAAERWQLLPDEKAALIAKFQRKSGLSG